MTEQEAEKPESPPKSPVGIVVALVILAAIIGGAVYFVNSGGNAGNGGNGGDGGDQASELLQEQLAELRAGLAATENLEPESAAKYWDSLHAAFPQDKSIALNRALNRVLHVDSLTDTATSTLSTPEEKKAARGQFIGASDAAQQAIEANDQVSTDPVTKLWLKTRIELAKADLLPPSQTKSIQMDVFDQIAESLDGPAGDKPQSVILGGALLSVLSELEDPIDGLPTKLRGRATEVVQKLSDKHPNNLYLAIRAARLTIEDEKSESAKYVERTYELSKAIEPLLAEATKPIGLTPREMVDEIVTAIGKSDWDTASNRMLQWFNVQNPMEILRTDRRRASPHPLDRLSFESLRRLSSEAIEQKPISKGDNAIQFSTITVEQSADVIQAIPVDFDLDLDTDIATLSKEGVVTIWKNDSGKWTSAGSVDLETKASGLVAADLFMVDSSTPDRIKVLGKTGDTSERDYSSDARHDTFPGLIAFDDAGVKLISIDGRETAEATERLKIVQKKSGLEEVPGITSIVSGDLEGDGDLDLVVATEEDGVRLFANRGNRTFFEVTLHDGGFDKSDPVSELAIADIDRDLDLDIVTVHSGSGRVGVLENFLHLQFRGRMIEEIPAIEGAKSVAVADLDGNVSWDIVIGGANETAVVFSQTADAGVWTVDEIKKQSAPGAGFALGDIDNDSWDEIVLPTGIMRAGPWGIDGAAKADLATDGSLCDVNNDGSLDWIGISNGQLQVATNDADAGNHHVAVRFKGIADNNANSGRVNHYGIGSVLELRFGPHYRSKIVTSPATHFGLDGFDAASSIRVIMPNGITQTIRDPKVDAIVEEKQTLKGSCPYLYAWDGEKYAFVTDCLWAAPLGLQVARGVVAKDRPWEYLKVDGTSIQPRNGKYDFRITEELWEVAYFDKVAVTAVDHPADVDIWTNEKVGPGFIAEHRVFAFGKQNLNDIKAAVDTRGNDVTKTISKIDRDFVQGFDRRLRQGLCEPHWVDLDFGDVKIEDKDAVFMVLTGWILPTDTSLNIQIDQNPNLPAIEFPSVWVPDAKEEAGWRKAIPFMGFPGGKTKTIVVDVTDVILRNDPRLRVRTSAQIYWDCAKLAIQSDSPEIVQQDLKLLSASVHTHGFSRLIKDGPKQPEVYDYQDASLQPKWPPLRGELTRMGSCVDLVREWDDEMAVISSGDEIRLAFSVPERPVPDGWRRDFVFHCVGWDKDADLNTLTGQTVGPLPFREMTAYPPTLAVSDRAKSVLTKNQDHLRREQSFRAFWYRPSSGHSGK